MHNFCHTHNFAKLLIVLVWGVFLAPFVVEAGDSSAPTYEGFPASAPAPPANPGITYDSVYAKLNTGFPTSANFQLVARDQYCLVRQDSGSSHFAPSKQAAGWQSFVANTPSNVNVEQCLVNESCFNRTIISYTAYNQAGQGVCYLDTNREITCTHHSTRVDTNGNAIPGFQDVSYLEYAGTGFKTCGIRANDLTITCVDGLNLSANPQQVHADRVVDNHPHGQYVDIEVAFTNACALSVDKTVDCWGYRHNNPLCFNGCTFQYIGAMEEPSGTFKSIDHMTGDLYCGIRENNTVACWGQARTGDNISTVLLPPTDSYQRLFDINLGGLNTAPVAICGVTDAGVIRCPSAGSMSGAGAQAYAVAEVAKVTALGPVEEVSISPQQRLLTAYDAQTNKVYRVTGYVSDPNSTIVAYSLPYSEVTNPGWNNPADAWWMAFDRGSGIRGHTCGFKGTTLICVDDFDGTQYTPPAAWQFYNNSYCSTLGY